MSEAAEFDIGSDVACSDGVCGKLTRVIVDPVARALTHLVVDPGVRQEEARLVPIDFVASSGNEIRLTCTRAQFGAFEEAEDSEFLPATSGQYGYKGDEVLSLPYYGLHGTGLRMGSVGTMGPPPVPTKPFMTMCRWVRSRCAVASTYMPRMGRSGTSRGW